MSEDSRLYATLGPSPGAPSEEIKRAYRNLARRYHPDASGKPETERQFNAMVKAYRTIIARTGEGTARDSYAHGAHGSTRGRHSSMKKAYLAGPDPLECGAILASSADPEARADAAERLGLSGKLGAWVFLRKGLYDPDDRVAVATARSIAVLGIMQGAGEMASLYVRSGPVVRTALLDIAEATGERLFSPMLSAASTDPDPARASRAAALRSVIPL